MSEGGARASPTSCAVGSVPGRLPAGLTADPRPCRCANDLDRTARRPTSAPGIPDRSTSRPPRVARTAGQDSLHMHIHMRLCLAGAPETGRASLRSVLRDQVCLAPDAGANRRESIPSAGWVDVTQAVILVAEKIGSAAYGTHLARRPGRSEPHVGESAQIYRPGRRTARRHLTARIYCSDARFRGSLLSGDRSAEGPPDAVAVRGASGAQSWSSSPLAP